MRIQLGAYGFLAGTTVEKEGLPNAGLYDQRAVLQWIQDYIHLVGGDKRQVSAWGQSAGASSILHHLTAFGGTQDPLFSRAILQSPGHGLSFDRRGYLEQAFQDFATRAGCAGKGLACLRAASAEALEAANNEGSYAFFPSADGKFVRQLAILELASGTCLTSCPSSDGSFAPQNWQYGCCVRQKWTISQPRNMIYASTGAICISKLDIYSFSINLPSIIRPTAIEKANLGIFTGNYWKHLDSIILSHVLEEAKDNLPTTVNTDEDFNNYVSGIFPPYAQAAGLPSRVIARYPPVRDGRGVYVTERQRLEAFFGDVVFLCNIRALTDAYTGKNFNLQYSTSPSTHNADVPPTFFFPGFDLDVIAPFLPPIIPGFEAFAQTYQSYLVSHARSGNPNTYRKSCGGFEAIRWPRPDNRGDALKKVLNATDTGFEVITDEKTRKSTCRFWEEIARDVTELGGLF
jgi:hypothetical protein